MTYTSEGRTKVQAPDERTRLDAPVDLCRFRSDDDLLVQQKKFVQYFTHSPGPVLDLGCGRGIMLQLLGEAGVDAYGIDTFGPALEACKNKGLQALDCDLFTHLARLPDESLGGIFCCHVIEHFQPPQALLLLREASRVVKQGGTLVLVTPNPKDLNVLTESFWLDMTHVRFYPARLLQLLLNQVGFETVACFEDKDTQYSKVYYRRIAAFLRRIWLWGFTNRGDVVAVAGK